VLPLSFCAPLFHYDSGVSREPHSFPTRRSSDLSECAPDADPVPDGRADLLPVALVVFAGLAVREVQVQDRGAVLGESHFGVSSERAGGVDRVGHHAAFRFMASHSMAAPSSIQGHSPPDLRVSGMCRPRMRSFRHRLTIARVSVSSTLSGARPIPISGHPSCCDDPRGRMLRSPSPPTAWPAWASMSIAGPSGRSLMLSSAAITGAASSSVVIPFGESLYSGPIA